MVFNLSRRKPSQVKAHQLLNSFPKSTSRLVIPHPGRLKGYLIGKTNSGMQYQQMQHTIKVMVPEIPYLIVKKIPHLVVTESQPPIGLWKGILLQMLTFMLTSHFLNHTKQNHFNTSISLRIFSLLSFSRMSFQFKPFFVVSSLCTLTGFRLI